MIVEGSTSSSKGIELQSLTCAHFMFLPGLRHLLCSDEQVFFCIMQYQTMRTAMALDGALRYRRRLLLGCLSELVGFVQDSHLCQSDVLNSPEATPLSTSASSNRNRLHTNETSPNDDLKTWLNIGFWPYYGSRMFGLREGPLLNEFLLTAFLLQTLMIFHLIFHAIFFFFTPLFFSNYFFYMVIRKSSSNNVHLLEAHYVLFLPTG